MTERATPAVGNVLVVDDDPQVRRTIQWTLEDEGLTVNTAADGRQALERAAESAPALVLLDLRLPVSDGAVVATELRAACGVRLPILLLTADDRAAQLARSLGAIGYLRKPFELEELIAVVQRALAGEPLQVPGAWRGAR